MPQLLCGVGPGEAAVRSFSPQPLPVTNRDAPGGYRFLPGIPAFSSGVVAQPGWEIVHATLIQPVPWREGFARIDFLVPPDAVYISEMNTIPGFTATSMFPKQAELAGIGFGQLVDRLVRLALEREGPIDASSPGPRAEELE